ncbi:MAG: hypothetical protein GF331_06090, partial [Chitinivibrionales bacterium]|nr:hypothetical protein [Chitinivibrionales bacterium]
MNAKNNKPLRAPHPALHPSQTRLTGGILAHRYRANIDNLFMQIDIDSLRRVFAETHDQWYAEPEFCGMYLDTAIQLYRGTGDERIRERAELLAGAIMDGQRSDGYLGTLDAGLEFAPTFSVWNQAFVLMGLLSYYEETGNERALDSATRCLGFIADGYLSGKHPFLKGALNQGIQNACILRSAARLYGASGSEAALRFCSYIIEETEKTPIALLSAPMRAHTISVFGCLKAIEILVCYHGMAEMYAATGDTQYLDSARKYWEMIDNTQIGITGCGSLGELWTYFGNKPLSVSTDLSPNENCVAVGWMKLSAMLHQWSGEARFFDAFERSLYNHLLGSQALDGRDFSYYQGLYGYKVHEKSPGMYSCCRYRGMNMLAHLPSSIVTRHDAGLSVNLYVASETTLDIANTTVTLTQTTDFPRAGAVSIAVRPSA